MNVLPGKWNERITWKMELTYYLENGMNILPGKWNERITWKMEWFHLAGSPGISSLSKKPQFTPELLLLLSPWCLTTGFIILYSIVKFFK
jgi:hypothetical protein